MQLGYRKRSLPPIAAVTLVGLAAILLWRPVSQILGLVLGAAALCFVTVPMERVIERRLPRPAASLVCLVCLALIIASALWLLLPTILREIMELARTLPASVEQASGWLATARAWLSQRLPGVALPELDFSMLQESISGIVTGTLGFAANLAEAAGRVSMIVVLAYFLLRDRDAVLLRLELLLPRKVRSTAIAMANNACRELRLYLQGQLMIAAAVAALSCVALMIVGVRSALVLGLLIGILNMIPYFGPFIGGVPAVLIALSGGWKRALFTLAALTVVQQVDGTWISPRVMGSVTGFSPALVLVGIYAGARLGGVLGMLLSLPVMMTSRTLFRVFVQKCENI